MALQWFRATVPLSWRSWVQLREQSLSIMCSSSGLQNHLLLAGTRTPGFIVALSHPQEFEPFVQRDPIRYRPTAATSDCILLNPDDRHFRVPRAQELEQAMGRHIWYAEGASNR